MNPNLKYHVDRRLSVAELAKLAGDAPKIPEEFKDHLEMCFTSGQYGDFYVGFTVAALDVFRHFEYPDAEGLRLPRVQYIAALILERAGHLFRHLELPYPIGLRKKLRELPLPARTAFQSLIMDYPCEPHEYETLKQTARISGKAAVGEYLRLDKPPMFYAGLFHGYYKLHAFLADAPDATDENRADFVMSTAVFLAEQIVTHGDSVESEDKSTEAGSSSRDG